MIRHRTICAKPCGLSHGFAHIDTNRSKIQKGGHRWIIFSNIGTIKDILNRHGFAFSKSLGQNFLINPSVCPRIAEEGNARKGFGIIEIGTGIGVLTAELAKARR